MENLAKVKPNPSKKLKPIARKRRNFVYLLLAILFAITTAAIFFNRPPNYGFPIMNFSIPILPIFILSIAACLFSLFTFIFNSKLYGAIICIILISILILRLIFLYF